MPGLRVLLAEDEPITGLATEAVLRDQGRDQGHEVIFASDGAKALEAARRQPLSFGLLITDRAMPGLDGAGLIRALRAERPALPVVAITGYPLSPEERATLDGSGAGPTVLLDKPWTVAQMAEAVRRVTAVPRGRWSSAPEAEEGR